MTSRMIAQAESGQAEIVYEFTRLSGVEGWWAWASLVSAVAFGLYAIVKFYRRDVKELSVPTGRTLIFLRLGVVVGLVFLFADLQRRTERTITLPSEVAVLVDTSQSMTLPSANSGVGPSREQRAAELLQETPLLSELSKSHRINLYAFGQESEAKLLQATGLGVTTGDHLANGDEGSAKDTKSNADPVSADGNALIEESGLIVNEPSTAAIAGAVILVMGLGAALVSLLLGVLGWQRNLGWILLSSSVLIGAGMILLGGTYAVSTPRSLSNLLTGGMAEAGTPSGDERSGANEQALSQTGDGSVGKENLIDSGQQPADWRDGLVAAAAESRIGDAIQTALNQHDPATLAGVVLITDGQNNGGSDVNAVLSSARRNEISIYPVGLGSGDAPLNVRVVDVDAPRRVYPGDKFTVTATLQASGPQPVQVDVELLDGLDDHSSVESSGERSDGNAANANGSNQQSGPNNLPRDVIERRSLELPVDGTLVPVRFEMEPESVGRRRVAVRVLAAGGDRNGVDQNPRDDTGDARYEVVARKLRVLAIAGGPTREYRFVRNLYYRDRSMDLDVWLQTGQSGMSQDADQLLTKFPSDPNELFEYDVIAMFDPDWTALSLPELELLERWVSQQAGGLILVAGPVYHSKWTRLRTDPRLPKIAGLFPVNFSTRGVVVASGRQGGEASWPLEFTQEARRAEFLWVAGDAEKSQSVWRDFSGVYDFVDTKDAKPASKVYAFFSDPTTQTGGSLPIYLASQFYGAGRTFFQASGEMWRLRGEGDQYFQSYFTKLARWVSEGRLLRDSTRGILLLDTSTAMVGDSISVRAVLSGEQFEPLDVPQVDANLLTPDGRIQELKLLPLQGEARPGTYGGQFVVREAGDYEVRLTLGDALNEQLLQQGLRVRLPTLELERPRRNDELLERLASMTSGQYFQVDESVSGLAVAEELIGAILPQPQESVLPGTYDVQFNLRRNAVLMWLLATFLTMEWIVRRLHRLA